jgi:hypothetical protein
MTTQLIYIEHFGYDFISNENAILLTTNPRYHLVLFTPRQLTPLFLSR